MSTIRIYKVAEVLGIPSHDVIDLLKREHGIEVKSASSTIEEIVARQFVERTARERNLSLPAGQLFATKPAAKSKTKGTKTAKSSEPSMRPRLGPPRLVKAPKPTPPPEPEGEVTEESVVTEPEPTLPEPVKAVEPEPAPEPEPARPARAIKPRRTVRVVAWAKTARVLLGKPIARLTAHGCILSRSTATTLTT